MGIVIMCERWLLALFLMMSWQLEGKFELNLSWFHIVISNHLIRFIYVNISQI